MQTKDVRTGANGQAERLNLRIGELVEVRSEREILATLDERGRLDSLPFMPEMLQYCGRRFRVYKLAIKACDSISNTGMYRMENAVHLAGTRCDGQAHGGCLAGCLLYWKEAWLKRVDAAEPAPEAPNGVADAFAEPPRAEAPGAGGPAAAAEPAPRCTRDLLMRATRAEASDPDGEEVYACQATEMPKAASKHISAWDVRQYVLDVTSGNARALPMLRSLLIMAYNKYQKVSKRVLPKALLINGGQSFRFVSGPLEGKTPKEVLNLQPGELVEIKSKEEILATLDKTGHNRGLRFDVEELKYCGTRARVLRRVNRIVDENTGKMLRLPNDCVILEGVICPGDYHQYCPRSIYPFWREIWLRRVEEPVPAATAEAETASTR
jgi:hypothetical protein